MGSPRQDFEHGIEDVRQIHEELVADAGGTPGGTRLFFIGLVLAAAGLYLFLDSVRVVTLPAGMLSGFLDHGMFRNGAPTTSTGILFAPIFLGLITLFYDARLKFGWALFYIGVSIIVIEILSRIQFMMNTKTSHLLLMLGMIAAGIGLMLRSFREPTARSEKPEA